MSFLKTYYYKLQISRMDRQIDGLAERWARVSSMGYNLLEDIRCNLGAANLRMRRNALAKKIGEELI